MPNPTTPASMSSGLISTMGRSGEMDVTRSYVAWLSEARGHTIRKAWERQARRGPGQDAGSVEVEEAFDSCDLPAASAYLVGGQ